MAIGRPVVPKVRVQCFVCGREVEKYPSQIRENTTGRFFCSMEHRNEAGKPRTVKPKVCELEGCEQEFVSYTDGRFCSKAHYVEWQGRNKVHLTCKNCGRDYTVSPSQAKHRLGQFCTRKCQGEAQIKRPLDRMHNGKPAVLDRNGYVRVYEPNHPRATKTGWQFEHRLVAEKHLGRYLAQHEHVHHINGQKADNRLENLAVLNDLEHLELSGNDYRAQVVADRAELEQYRKLYGALPVESV